LKKIEVITPKWACWWYSSCNAQMPTSQPVDLG